MMIKRENMHHIYRFYFSREEDILELYFGLHPNTGINMLYRMGDK